MLNLTFEQKIRIYDTIIWTCLAGIVIWLILKVAGIIHTPAIITYFPVFLGVVSFGILLVKLSLYFGSLTTNMKYILKELEALKKAEQMNTQFRLRIGNKLVH